jgi:hypothetical protein
MAPEPAVGRVRSVGSRPAAKAGEARTAGRDGSGATGGNPVRIGRPEEVSDNCR